MTEQTPVSISSLYELFEIDEERFLVSKIASELYTHLADKTSILKAMYHKHDNGSNLMMAVSDSDQREYRVNLVWTKTLKKEKLFEKTMYMLFQALNTVFKKNYTDYIERSKGYISDKTEALLRLVLAVPEDEGPTLCQFGEEEKKMGVGVTQVWFRDIDAMLFVFYQDAVI